MSIPDLHNIVQALGWTLVHFLWQGAVLCLVFAVAMRLAASGSAWLRYRLALALFIATGLMPVVTFWMVFDTAQGPAALLGTTGAAVQAGAVSAAGGAGWLLALERALEPHLAWAVAFWLAGVIVMSGRVCLDWWQVRRLTWVGVEPLPARWNDRVTELVRTFRVARPVRVLRSSIVRVPAVIGWLRPVVLIPTAALAGLSPRQLELIIAHELAHIHRADYLVNLLQVIIETVLFYHPAVRWMSNRVRQERELCCDDAVIATCGDTLTYAQALTQLEVQRQAGFQTALAASGGQLSQRIYRMLDGPVPRRNTLVWAMSLVVGLAAGSMALAAQLALTSSANQDIEPVASATPSAVETRAPARTAPPEAVSAGAGPARADEPETVRPEPVPRSVNEGPAAQTSNTANRADQGTGSRNPDAAPVESTAAPSASNDPAPGQVAAADARRDDAEDAARPAAGQAPARESLEARDRSGPQTSGSPDASDLAALDPLADTGDRGGETTRLASAARPDSKAAEPARPEVRGGEALHVAAPQYPRRARVRGLQGSVAAEFTIGRDGRVKDVAVTDSSPAGVFDRAVIRALKDWRFEPMTRDGERVTRRVSKVFEFNIEGEPRETTQISDECDPVTGTRICRQ